MAYELRKGRLLNSVLDLRIWNKSSSVLACVAAAVLFAGCASFGGSDEATRKTQLFYDLALAHYQDGQFPDSIANLQQVLARDSDSYQAKILLGLNYLAVDSLDAAEKITLEACNSKGANSDCWNNLSAIYLKSRKYNQAVDAANQALADLTYPTPSLALANLAQAQIALKELSQAQTTLEHAKKLDPRNCQIRVLLGRVLTKRGALEEALQETRVATSQCPLSAVSHLWEAYTLYLLGDREKASKKLHFIVEQFKRGEIVEKAQTWTDLLQNRIPLQEPPI